MKENKVYTVLQCVARISNDLYLDWAPRIFSIDCYSLKFHSVVILIRELIVCTGIGMGRRA